jgi:hypothetical protein
MRVKNYSTLKAAGSASFSKGKDDDDNDIIQLTEKRFNASTGEALDDSVHEVDLNHYKSEKSQCESEKARCEVDIAELKKIIVDIEKL